MAYSEEEMCEIEKNPDRLRAYFWRIAMGMRLQADKIRHEVHDHAILSSPVAFDLFSDDRRDAIKWAKALDRTSEAILSNLNEFVRSCSGQRLNDKQK